MPQLSAVGSVPFTAYETPQEVFAEGVRLDGRGYEEFRTLCKLVLKVVVMLPITAHTSGVVQS